MVQFKNWLQVQRLLIAPDSMAGHLAAYLKIPVISLFGAQNPELTKPLGDKIIVANPGKECVHQRDHWRLCSSCMNAIDPELVHNSAVNLLRYNYGK
jgi:ADP-heptose:LPS heptosyltransferase